MRRHHYSLVERVLIVDAIFTTRNKSVFRQSRAVKCFKAASFNILFIKEFFLFFSEQNVGVNSVAYLGQWCFHKEPVIGCVQKSALFHFGLEDENVLAS